MVVCYGSAARPINQAASWLPEVMHAKGPVVSPKNCIVATKAARCIFLAAVTGLQYAGFRWFSPSFSTPTCVVVLVALAPHRFAGPLCQVPCACSSVRGPAPRPLCFAGFLLLLFLWCLGYGVDITIVVFPPQSGGVTSGELASLFTLGSEVSPVVPLFAAGLSVRRRAPS